MWRPSTHLWECGQIPASARPATHSAHPRQRALRNHCPGCALWSLRSCCHAYRTESPRLLAIVPQKKRERLLMVARQFPRMRSCNAPCKLHSRLLLFQDSQLFQNSQRRPRVAGERGASGIAVRQLCSEHRAQDRDDANKGALSLPAAERGRGNVSSIHS